MAVTCDVCGKEIPKGFPHRVSFAVLNENGSVSMKVFDLCAECQAKIVDIIEGKKL